jgi:hypothetical protein
MPSIFGVYISQPDRFYQRIFPFRCYEIDPDDQCKIPENVVFYD